MPYMRSIVNNVYLNDQSIGWNEIQMHLLWCRFPKRICPTTRGIFSSTRARTVCCGRTPSGMETQPGGTSCSSVSPSHGRTIMNRISVYFKSCMHCFSFLLSFFSLARTGKIDPKDVDTFKRQVECLNFPEDYHSYDGETGQWPSFPPLFLLFDDSIYTVIVAVAPDHHLESQQIAFHMQPPGGDIVQGRRYTVHACLAIMFLEYCYYTFTFTFRAFGFYPNRLTKSKCVEGDSNISLWYIKISI